MGWAVPVIVGLNLFTLLVLTTQASRNLWRLDAEAEADVDGSRAAQSPAP